MPQFATKTHFIQIKLNELIEAIGEEKVKSILSSFVCPLNKDVEDFLRNKAIVFSARNFAKTNLVFWEPDDQKLSVLTADPLAAARRENSVNMGFLTRKPTSTWFLRH